MQIYLDNSATTQVSEPVLAIMEQAMRVDFGNPSSLHTMGMEAENYIKKAKTQIANTLRVQEKEIFFTSCGTESDNMAIIGSAFANMRKGKHLITTAIEHAAVGSTMKFLEEQGFEVTYLPVDEYGVISLDDLRNAIREDTILVSMMYVNNEIGSVMPIHEAGELIKECNPDTLFHVDAIQGYGKFKIYPKQDKIDLLAVSGHKIHGPKGVGFLYIKEKTKVKPIIHGGGHQNGMRSGTENVPGVAGLGLACELAYTDFEAKVEHMYALREHFIEEAEKIEGVSINGRKTRENAPHIVSVSVPGVRSEVLLHSLEDKGIYVSAGSACSSNKPSISATLKAIGLPKEKLESTVRISFCETNTLEEVDATIAAMKELIPMLTRFVRR
ncbi:cysteine desulfurase [Lachnospiraceae bacterium XBB1006]|nr:cysteine desulfurase [Lachnospiraceae bacterium XBB1006]